MATATTQMPTNSDPKPSSPVDLSTIPISPDGGDKSNGHLDENSNPNGEKSDGEQITVFHDKDNFNVKHPLMHKWTLWFTKPPSGRVSLFQINAVRRR